MDNVNENVIHHTLNAKIWFHIDSKEFANADEK